MVRKDGSMAGNGDLHADELVRRIKLGSRDAFESFFVANQPALLRYLRILGVCDANDLAQETWIGLSRALATFNGDSAGLRALLFQIARRRYIDDLRSRKRRPLTTNSPPPETADRVASDISEEISEIDEAIERLAPLPSLQREIVALRVLLDMSPAEVADQIGRSEGYVRVNYHRAIRSLEASTQFVHPGRRRRPKQRNVPIECNEMTDLDDLTDIQARSGLR